MLNKDPLEDVQSLFCDMVKNEEQEERTSSFKGVNQLIVFSFPACRSCEALDLEACILYTVVDGQI